MCFLTATAPSGINLRHPLTTEAASQCCNGATAPSGRKKHYLFFFGGEVIDFEGRPRLVRARVWVYICPNFLASNSPLRKQAGAQFFAEVQQRKRL